MKKAIKELAPGDIFTYAGEDFVVLEHSDDGVLILACEKCEDSAFQTEMSDTMNDYLSSELKKTIEGFVNLLGASGASNDDFVPFVLDRNETDMSGGYGDLAVYAAPLTLWQYGKFRGIIPSVNYKWWLATPYATRRQNSPYIDGVNAVFYVDDAGFVCTGICEEELGVRPALKLDPEVLVSISDAEDDCEECDGFCECDNYHVDLSRVSTVDLLQELRERLEREAKAEEEPNE